MSATVSAQNTMGGTVVCAAKLASDLAFETRDFDLASTLKVLRCPLASDWPLAAFSEPGFDGPWCRCFLEDIAANSRTGRTDAKNAKK